ncbi:MAG TPA: M48 family metallopeptidase [Burkholderiales bacterium]|nr:M48 family metallopeptidase [Burkholderiales bacterium]
MRRLIILLLALSMPFQARAFQLDIGKIKSLVTNASQLREVDEKQEVEIGSGVASNLLGAAPLMPDAHVQKYVNQVGRWVAQQSERPNLDWHFGVLESNDVNAFATPGGYVFITKGLLLNMKSEAELAGVLAHEIGHVLKKHHLKAIQKNAQVGLLADALSIATQSSKNTEALNKIAGVGTELYARGLDKEDEFEADRIGVVLAARAGYDPYGLPLVLQTLANINPQDSALALMFKTHPAPTARLEALDKTMPVNLDKYATQPQLATRFVKTLELNQEKLK